MDASPWGKEKRIGRRAEMEGTVLVAWKGMCRAMQDVDLDICLFPSMWALGYKFSCALVPTVENGGYIFVCCLIVCRRPCSIISAYSILIVKINLDDFELPT